MAQRIVAVTAGLSVPSSTRLLTDRIVAATRELAKARGDQVQVGRGQELQIDVVELRDLAQDIAAHLVTRFPSERLAQVLEGVSTADGLIVVTPTFAGSYSGLFKSFFDLLEPTALAGTPVLLAATGGTARHSLMLDHAMRPLFAYLQAEPVATGIFAATDDFADAGLARRIDRAAGQLVAAVGANARTTYAAPTEDVPDPAQSELGAVPDFRDLLFGKR
ncbi:CE1759 family FMN reductase [Allobranchiibius sp. GilTou38]|uniref:CE1759 family FMN reductase n=1 Tax=Allobranchiibius sp. GilTou38 TaxID=2815210 RepID=UPI001AA1993D|nr:CE1759 family FMN reductase [Allobranchiibius sp. GilTou38]MBO1768206.1 NAD(P)H-dependent oxidoreductase [Allobranchiibius sp. GilTou38]